jgi:energy-coupling factor transport system substrate-specific component
MELPPPFMNPRLLALIPTCVALNVVLGRVVSELALPIFLDTVGTVTATALAGPVAGIITGLTSQGLTALTSGQMMWLAFAPIQVLIALVASSGSQRSGFATASSALLWGALCGLLGGLVSAVISYTFFGGVTSTGVTALNALLRYLDFGLATAVTISSIAADVLDKALTFAFAGAVLRALPTRLASRFPLAMRSAGRE